MAQEKERNEQKNWQTFGGQLLLLFPENVLLSLSLSLSLK